MSPAASSRWCPTPEQLMMLEEMYRSGIRTPNAVQIQQITAHLASYGRIEGKNVFYWFQNHKARDRQKLRKKLTKQLQQQQQLYQPYNYNTHNQHHGCSYDHFSSASGSKLPFPQYYYPSPSFLPQGERKEESDIRVKNRGDNDNNDNTAWNNDVQAEKIMGSTYSRDWMMMMMMVDVGPSSPCFNVINPPRPPLKTLELFPITSTSSHLKEPIRSPN